MGIIGLIIGKLIDIIAVVFAGVIGIYIEKKVNSSKLLLIYPGKGDRYTGYDDLENNISVIEGYYNKQKMLNDNMISYLKLKGYDASKLYDNILRDMVIIYRFHSDNLKIKKIIKSKNIEFISQIISYLYKDEVFISMIKVYEAYMNNSKWLFELINVGKQDIYNLQIERVDNDIGRSITIGGTLKVDEHKKVTVYYFDESLVLNLYNIMGENELQSCCANNAKQEFFLVKKRRYNRKYERLFKITYVSSRKKTHTYYCCAKLNIIEKKKIKK